MYRLCLWKEQTESFNHWNSKVVMVTTLRLLASVLIVIIEIRGAASGRGWSRWLSFSFLKQWQYQWQFMTVFFHALFIVHIYLCLQCLIPYSISPIICYPVDANLHYVFNHCCVCSSFSGGLHASGQIWSWWRSPNVPMIWFTIYQDYMVTCMFVKFM